MFEFCTSGVPLEWLPELFPKQQVNMSTLPLEEFSNGSFFEKGDHSDQKVLFGEGISQQSEYTPKNWVSMPCLFLTLEFVMQDIWKEYKKLIGEC